MVTFFAPCILQPVLMCIIAACVHGDGRILYNEFVRVIMAARQTANRLLSRLAPVRPPADPNLV